IKLYGTSTAARRVAHYLRVGGTRAGRSKIVLLPGELRPYCVPSRQGAVHGRPVKGIERKKAQQMLGSSDLVGRGEWIRTTDPSAPNRVLYQAEPRPDRRCVRQDPAGGREPPAPNAYSTPTPLRSEMPPPASRLTSDLALHPWFS